MSRIPRARALDARPPLRLTAVGARECRGAPLAGTSGERAHTRARELLSALGLEDRLEFRVDQLSDGERQRVAIARAMASRPQLIIADESTANLGSAKGAETMRLLRKLA